MIKHVTFIVYLFQSMSCTLELAECPNLFQVQVAILSNNLGKIHYHIDDWESNNIIKYKYIYKIKSFFNLPVMLLIKWLKCFFTLIAMLYSGVWHPVTRSNLISYPRTDHFWGHCHNVSNSFGEIVYPVNHFLSSIYIF